jgi:hypothetical protein
MIENSQIEDDQKDKGKVKEEENKEEDFKEYKFLKEISQKIGIEKVMIGIAVLRDFDI